MPLNQPTKSEITKVPASKFILMGEDDADDEELLKEVFFTIDQSLELHFYNSGSKLVSSLNQMDKMPCLIILDYNMPALNGAEILEELAKDNRYAKIPKIIWSTSGSETYKSKCLQLGASEYIIKPTSVKELSEVARYMLSFC